LIDVVAVLFAVFGSVVALLTVVTLVTFPLPEPLATMVTVACPPLARVPIEQVTVRLPAA
jgi:hypothetical protein